MGVAESDPSLCAPEVVGNAFNSILPGSKEVYNAKAKKWQTPAQPNAAPFIAFLRPALLLERYITRGLTFGAVK